MGTFAPILVTINNTAYFNDALQGRERYVPSWVSAGSARDERSISCLDKSPSGQRTGSRVIQNRGEIDAVRSVECQRDTQRQRNDGCYLPSSSLGRYVFIVVVELYVSPVGDECVRVRTRATVNIYMCICMYMSRRRNSVNSSRIKRDKKTFVPLNVSRKRTNS